MIRKYEPELRSIPLTFMDCQDGVPWTVSLSLFGKIFDYPTRLCVAVSCEVKGDCPHIRANGNCPRGFP
jgi:hypothetical protein